jgi:hypothetical protein
LIDEVYSRSGNCQNRKSAQKPARLRAQRSGDADGVKRSPPAADEPNLNGAVVLAFTVSTKSINMTNYQCDEHRMAIVST